LKDFNFFSIKQGCPNGGPASHFLVKNTAWITIVPNIAQNKRKNAALYQISVATLAIKIQN